LQEVEYEHLEAEHYKISNSKTILEACQRELQHLYDSDELIAFSMLHYSAQLFAELANYDERLASVAALLDEGAVQVE
ncbi:DNA repair protein RecN, partial [Pseudoalteromonas sp. S979]